MTLRYTQPQDKSLDIALRAAYRLAMEATKGCGMKLCRVGRLAAFALGFFALGACAHDGESLGQVDFPISCSAAQQQPFNRALIDRPQYAIAQSGSDSAIIAKAFGACGNQNEWNIASARLNGCC